MAAVADGTNPARMTIYDAFRKPDDRRLRRLPGLVAGAFRLVWQAARRELVAAIVLQVVLGVGVAAQVLVGSRVLATILDADREGSAFSAVVPGLAVLLGVTAVVAFANSARQELQALLTELTGRHAQDRVIDVASVVDLEAFENPEFHDRLQRAQVAATSRPYRMTSDLVSLLGGIVGVAGLLAALAALEPVLAPIVLLAYIPLWLAMMRNSRTTWLFNMHMTPSDRQRQYLGFVLSGKDYAQELRVYSLAAFIRRHYDRIYDERIGELRRMVHRRLRRSLLASVGTSVLSAASIALLVALLLADRVSVPEGVAAAVAIQQLGGRLFAISFAGSMLYENTLFIDDFNSFLELAPALEAARPAGPAPDAFTTLAVEEVSFAYPGTDRLALDGVSLELHRGEVCALVGENGSGKTTLAKILCHLYSPTSGRVLWDDVDTATCDAEELRRHVAVIFQDFVHYFLTAQHNVGVGDHRRADDLEEVVAAARDSGADQFLAALPEGYATILGRQFEGGVELSVGQWQRVALARAFFRQAPFVILDEPTSALDPRAEHELFERMREMARGRTVLLISHRFSSVRSADRIFVLDHGRLVESGSHEELVAGRGLYAELFSLQASAYQAS